MASFMRSLIINVITNSMSIICGILCIVRLLYMWLTLPSGSLTRRKKRPIPPACLNNPELGNHNYVQVNNVKLHYVEKGDRSKPLMLFIHGFPEFWYSWRHQIKEFSKDYWVVAPDLRGYADSEKPDGIKYYKLKYLVEDIKNLVTAFEKEKVTVVGHDWGGVIVWYFLMLHPELVETYIVMNAPHPSTFRKHLSTSFSQFRKSWYIFFFKLPYLPEFVLSTEDYKFLNTIFHSKKKPSPFSEEDKEAFRFTFSKPGALTPPINFYRANLTPDLNIRKEIKLKKTKYPPGLLIFGEGDKFIDVESVKDTKKSVPNLTIEFVKDASHFVQQDEPETVNKLMRDFLEKLPELIKQEEAQQQ